MPTFATPQPITARVQASAGSIRLIAGERPDTTVEVRPRDESSAVDVRSAEQARVYYANGTLSVSPAKFGFLGYRMGAVDVVIELPSRSRVDVAVASADVHAEGEFADFRSNSASGGLQVSSIRGSAKITSASGDAAIADLDGQAEFQAASGSLTLDRLRGDLKSQVASGSVRVAAAVSGAVVAHTSSGDVEIGIPKGTAARLDVMTGSGTVTNRLQPSDGPEHGDDTVVVQVRTGSGDVDIHRAATAAVSRD
jgi:DUF4097 and DUF4098 domain-containing protein YvlB